MKIGSWGAAYLFLAVKNELEADRQTSWQLGKGPHREEVAEELALVVGAASCVDATVPDGRLEGRRGPPPLWVYRLHVVVAIEKNRGCAGGPYLREDNRVTVDLDRLDRPAVACEQALQVIGRLAQPRALCADAGDPQGAEEVVQALGDGLRHGAFDVRPRPAWGRHQTGLNPGVWSRRR